MSMPSIVCGTCQAPVPYGRLSCPACGELLASVAGAGRRMGITVLPSPGFDAEPDDVSSAPVVDAAPVLKPSSRKRSAMAVPTVLPDPAESWDADPGTDDDDADEALVRDVASSPVEPTAQDAPGPRDVADAPVVPTIAAVAAAAPPIETPPPVEAPAPVEPPPPPVEPALPPEPLVPTAVEPLLDDDRPQPSVLSDVAPAWPADQPPPAPLPVPDPTPGAYVPPPVIPAGPALPAREYAGANGAAAGVAASALASQDSAGTDATGRLDALDPAKVAEFVDWMAVAGAALAAVGFALPWSITVIGSSGVDYFERWGLAGPGHPLVVVALLAILVLAILHNPIPAWIRVGVAGLAVGAFLLGVLWPYVVGPLGALPGAIASLVGTVVLLAASIVALIVHRHATEQPGV